MMSEMDGLQFLEQVRTKNEYDEIPFIFVTALIDKEDIQRALELKASGYLLKPIMANQMINKLVSSFPELKETAKRILKTGV